MTILSTTTFFDEMEQTGRLFNRAPMHFSTSPHFRRKLQPVSSYHDFDDIPTMAKDPDMKSCGGVRFESPQTVTDVKHFDPVAYEDELAGVPIDICDPESDEEDDFSFIDAQEEQVEERETSFEPLRKPSFLAPILEERKVTFAAQHVVLKVNSNGCAIDQRFVHQVVDAVQVCFIPHLTEYNEFQRASLWYTQAELASMKQRAFEAKMLKKREQRRSLRKAAQEKQQLDSCSLFPSPLSNQPVKNKASPRSTDERRARYEAMVDAVLLEQYEQRLMCLKVFGRIDEGFTGILDSDRLAKVCSIAGDTTRSHEKAVEKAAKALDMDEEDFDSNRPRSSITSASVSGRKLKQPKQPKMKRSQSFNSKAIAVETTQCMDKSIFTLFQSLVSPFLEIRKGDLFLEVGEEMSITI